MIEYVSHSLQNEGPIILPFAGKKKGFFCAEVCLRVDGNEKMGIGSIEDNYFDALAEAFCQALSMPLEIESCEIKDRKVTVEVVVNNEKSKGFALSDEDRAKAFLLALTRAVNYVVP